MSSSATAFYVEPRPNGWLFFVLVQSCLISLWISIRRVELIWMVFSIVALLEGVYYGVAFFRRRTPVVAISGNSLEFGSPYLFRRHGSVPLSEITDMEIHRRAIDLVTPRGRVTVSLWNLTEDQQRAVAEAVRQHLGEAAPQMG